MNVYAVYDWDETAAGPRGVFLRLEDAERFGASTLGTRAWVRSIDSRGAVRDWLRASGERGDTREGFGLPPEIVELRCELDGEAEAAE